VVQLDAQQHFKSFSRDAEGLNDVSSQCPAPAQ
jgi:hypothetical protein